MKMKNEVVHVCISTHCVNNYNIISNSKVKEIFKYCPSTCMCCKRGDPTFTQATIAPVISLTTKNYSEGNDWVWGLG